MYLAYILFIIIIINIIIIWCLIMTHFRIKYELQCVRRSNLTNSYFQGYKG
jgi:hypothetical protein